jgi:outer membrane immunogenic protein
MDGTGRMPVSRKGRIVMRKASLTLVAAAIGLAASQASAADLPQKAPAYIPPAPPPITWTGCYVGGNIGGAFGHASLSSVGGQVSQDGSGFAGGGQIGCDYQFSGGWVIGFRNMFDATSNNRDGTFTLTTATGTATGTFNFNNRWFDTLTGRVGYAVQPAWLLYFQGGAVWSRVEAGLTVTTPGGLTGVASASDTKTGWTIGGGVEWMFAPHWSAFLEGNYMDFGSRDGVVVTPLTLAGAPTACSTAGGCAFSTKATAATVLVGVNYRFF